MHKISEKESTTIDIIHEFYCDVCGKKYDEVIEEDDGWYNSPYIFKRTVCMKTGDNNGRYFVYEKHVCENCAEKEIEKINKIINKDVADLLLSNGYKSVTRSFCFVY